MLMYANLPVIHFLKCCGHWGWLCLQRNLENQGVESVALWGTLHKAYIWFCRIVSFPCVVRPILWIGITAVDFLRPPLVCSGIFFFSLILFKISFKWKSVHFWSLKVFLKLIQSISIFFSSDILKFLDFIPLSQNHLLKILEVCSRTAIPIS